MGMTDDFDFFQARRVHEKGALDSDAVGTNTANGKCGFDAAAAFSHDDALKNLNTLTVAFDNADVDTHTITRADLGDIFFKFSFTTVSTRFMFGFLSETGIARK